MAVLPLLWPETSMALVVTTSVITTVAALSLLRWTFYPVQERVIASPLKTVIPKLSRDEIAQLDYTPDAFPGARDVDTPVCVSLAAPPFLLPSILRVDG